ncbi:hypothetical protein KR074_000183, partial [Drosophila pseudoananassae]
AAFIKEYLELGYMSPVPADASVNGQYFLLHHCVLKEERRAVFDGSAVTTSGYSLNDVLMSGPVIQPKLLHILLRFRCHRVAITGDICKMYRCVKRQATYDPLGLVDPVISKAKIFLQKLCREKLSWDESLPQAL